MAKTTATPIPDEYVAKLKQMGITAKTVEQATPAVAKILADADMGGMENEDFDILMMMVDSLGYTGAKDDESEDQAAPEEEKTEASEEDDYDALADEVTQEDEETAAPELEEPAQEPESAPAPAPAPKPKAASKPQAAAKPVKEAKPKATRIDPKNNAADRALFKPLEAIFPPAQFAYDYVTSAGVTIKFKGQNSKRGLFLLENCAALDGQIVKCNMFLNTFTKQEKKDKLVEAGYDFGVSWNNLPEFKGISLEDAIGIITEFKDDILSTVETLDKRLGKQRQKMEDSLAKKPAAKTTKAPAKSAAKPDAELADPFDPTERARLKSFIKDNGLAITVFRNWTNDRIQQEIDKLKPQA